MRTTDYAYSDKVNAKMTITHAYCPEVKTTKNAEHDADVYLNECWNCNEVIDSRECHFKQANNGQYYPINKSEINGYYVCMKCGAGVQGLQPAICPKCGCKDPNLLKFQDIHYNNSNKRKFFECISCGYSSRNWKSLFE